MKRNFAYKLSSRGFLIVEHLIAMIIMSLLILLILNFIQITKSYASNVDRVSLNQVEALATQLQIESKLATRFRLNQASELEIELQNGTLVTYRIQNQKLIRQVDGKGGEVALYHCQALQVIPIGDYSVSLQLQTNHQLFPIYLTTLKLPLPSHAFLEVDEEIPLEEDEILEDEDLDFPQEPDSDESGELLPPTDDLLPEEGLEEPDDLPNEDEFPPPSLPDSDIENEEVNVIEAN